MSCMSTFTWPDQASTKSSLAVLKCRGGDHSKQSIFLDLAFFPRTLLSWFVFNKPTTTSWRASFSSPFANIFSHLLLFSLLLFCSLVFFVGPSNPLYSLYFLPLWTVIVTVLRLYSFAVLRRLKGVLETKLARDRKHFFFYVSGTICFHLEFIRFFLIVVWSFTSLLAFFDSWVYAGLICQTFSNLSCKNVRAVFL